jgi:hypothetical protein
MMIVNERIWLGTSSPSRFGGRAGVGQAQRGGSVPFIGTIPSA